MPSYRFRMEMQLAAVESGGSGRFDFFARSPHRSPKASGWVFLSRVPVNLHFFPAETGGRCFAFQPAFQTRSKCGLTLGASYVVSPVLTSGPLRLPYARNALGLEGFIHLALALTMARNSMETPGSQVQFLALFLRVPSALLRVPCGCPCPLLPRKHWSSPYR